MTQLDDLGAHRAGLHPVKGALSKLNQLPKRRDTTPSNGERAWVGKPETYREKDEKHYFLLALYGPQE